MYPGQNYDWNDVTNEVTNDMTNEVMANEVTNDMTNEVSNDKVMTNEVMTNEVMTNEVMNDEITNDEVMTNEVSNNEVMNDKVMTNEVSNNEVSNNEVMTNEFMANDLLNKLKEASIKNETEDFNIDAFLNFHNMRLMGMPSNAYSRCFEKALLKATEHEIQKYQEPLFNKCYTHGTHEILINKLLTHNLMNIFYIPEKYRVCMTYKYHLAELALKHDIFYDNIDITYGCFCKNIEVTNIVTRRVCKNGIYCPSKKGDKNSENSPVYFIFLVIDGVSCNIEIERPKKFIKTKS
jgi:hypothetical protein